MFRLPTAIRSVLVAALVLALYVPSASAAKRPRYGGTLRVELHEAAVSLDPREWKTGSLEAAANEKLGALVFDRLVTLDNYGRFQPQLASVWSHDAAMKRWQFTLRQSVKFSDGSVLTGADVVEALQPLLSNTVQIIASINTITIQFSVLMPDLLEQLVSGRYFVYRVQPDGTLLGTGPFFVTNSSANSQNGEGNSTVELVQSSRGDAGAIHLHFRANEETWSGRPFLDAIDVTLGVPSLRQLFDLQLGKADLVELSPDLVRRARQENLRIWSSALVTLLALRSVEDAQSAAPVEVNARLRDALSLSLDRGTMAGVLLQRQAEPASALLPQWLSGYAFLFTMDTNLDRPREIRAALPADVAAVSKPLRLQIDASGDLPKLLGERVAVNARQANFLVQVINRSAQRVGAPSAPPANDSAPGLHLFAWRYSSLSPRAELYAQAAAQHSMDSFDPEQLYASERKLLDDRRLLPLVAFPEYFGLGPNVCDWMPARWGEWQLADVWLDVPETAPTPSNVQSFARPATSQPQAFVPGAHP